MSDVRVRFCPSPTGNPHVGMVRTALFNWAYAKHTGGTFVFRIEDTDSARDSEQSYQQLLDALSWLGMSWDEGPEVGGPHAPYRQSQRMDFYKDVAQRLLDGGFAYHCFCTPEELEEQREQQKAAGRTPGYSGRCRDLSAVQRAERLAEGRQPAVRFRMPGTDFTWDDLVRGPLTFAAEHVPDYVLVRASGEPLYTLTNPCDDADMEITHVLRGEDLLSSTPRQIALYDALAKIGVGNGTTPRFGHLPYVMGEGNKKLSKRDPESSLQWYRDEGFVPEGLLNYLSLLGWSIGDDRDFFSMAEMAEVFDVADVNANPARFDLKKCTAINAAWIRELATDDLASRLERYLIADGALPEKPTHAQQALLRRAVPYVQERMETLRQGVHMLAFLFATDAGIYDEVTVGTPAFERDAAHVAAVINDDARAALQAARDALAAAGEWTHEALEAALRNALVEGLGLKPKLAFGPIRVAVSGRRVSPPLFESLELLGRERALARLDDLLN
ncbi:MAG: glutamate--tRNA ligase [Candidatus Nanopelagicales bacterium]